jgi:hypothetical protein
MNSVHEVPLPGKLSLRRQKLGQKAKQEAKGATFNMGLSLLLPMAF